MSISSGQVSPIMGQTLVKPLAQFMAELCMGQLQSHSHSPPPSGQLHLHEHCIPSPIGGEGPDPDPGGGTGCSPDPDPLPGCVGSVISSSALHFDIAPFPFFILRENVYIPISTTPVPEHFLSHVALPLHFAPSASRLKEQVQVLFPSFTFSPLKSSPWTVLATRTARREIRRNLIAKEPQCDFPM